MKNLFGSFLMIGLILSCDAPKKEKPEFSFKKRSDSNETPAPTRVDLLGKGVGPVSSITLPESIDEDLVNAGKEIFDSKCFACHKPTVKFIGPAPKGILSRRSPEWVMNMILNPTEMIEKDSLAKDLFMEFNGSPMANQGLSQKEARSVLEYFRTLE